MENCWGKRIAIIGNKKNGAARTTSSSANFNSSVYNNPKTVIKNGRA